MMEITRENYEAYFIDYLEGNLDVALVDRFIEFLQENPDLKEELKLFESVAAVPETTSFARKKQLYKEIYDLDEEFDRTAIANMEGDLLETEKQSFQKYLAAHPEKNREIALFEKTFLKADENVLFEHKNQLYKKSTRKIVFLWAGRVAAILILALAIFSLLDRNTKTVLPENQMAQVQEKTETKTEVPKEVVPKSETPVQTEKKKTDTKPETQVTEKKNQKKKESRSLRESTKGRTVQEDLLTERVPVEVPETMNSLNALVSAPAPHSELAVMTIVYPDYIPDDEHLLTDNLREKVSFKKITRVGLNLVTSLSNERFTYETNEEGKVTEYNYDSRLLAFSIPAIPNTDGE